MKKIVILVFSIGLVFFIGSRLLSKPGMPQAGVSAWNSVGPEGGALGGLAMNPKSSKELFVISKSQPGQVYASVDGGASWTRAGLIQEELQDVSFDPSDPSLLYVLGASALYKSSDGGRSFIQFRLPANSHAEEGRIAIHPTNSKTILIAGHSSSAGAEDKNVLSIFKTTNGGKNWSVQRFEPNSIDAHICDVSFSAKNPQTVYFCGYVTLASGNAHPRVYYSKDGARTWSNITDESVFSSKDNRSPAYAIAIDSSDANHVLVAHDYGVARTLNAGTSWSKQSSPTKDFRASAIGQDRSDVNTFYAISYSGKFGGHDIKKGCWKSVDGGVTWKLYGNGFYGVGARLLADGSQVLAATGAGLFVSNNGGLRWKPAHAGIQAGKVGAIAISSSSPGTIYAGISGYAFFRTDNGGNLWTKCAEFYRCESVSSILVHPSNPKKVYFLSGG